MSRLRDWLVSGALLLVGRRPRRTPEEAQRLVPRLPPNVAAENAVLALLALAAVFAIGFVLVFALDPPAQTQLLGMTLGFSLLFVAAALIVVGRSLVVTEEVVEPYPAPEHPHEQELVAELVEESGDRFTRKGLFKLGLLGAGGAIGLALLTPVASLGPVFRVREFLTTPWRRGRRLVDGDGKPYRAADVEAGTFYSAFPEGISETEKEQVAAPVLLVRLPPGSLRLPSELTGYDAGGIVCYSKICTHAGCAISMYRAPLFQPDEPKPALVCPCHYSTFDPTDGGSVVFGPAGRRLPMLPIETDRRGYLRAKGTFDEAVGPSWWGVRLWNWKLG